MSDAREAALFPLFLKLAGRRVLVVGAGPVAERKIDALLEAGADVLVVAPQATPAIRDLAERRAISWNARRFAGSDADGSWLIVAATNDPDAQESAAEAGAARRIFVLAVDDKANATAYGAAIVRRPPFTVAISSRGATPALTRLVREILEQVLPGKDWVEHATRLRAAWLASGTPMQNRFGELVRAFAARDTCPSPVPKEGPKPGSP